MTAPHETTMRRNMRRLLTVLALVVAGGLLYVVVLLYVRLQETVILARAGPPLSYDRESYPPERADLCPGETLVYTNSLHIDRPAVVWFVGSWFDRDHNLSVVPGDKLLYSNFTEPVTITRRRSNPVPQLPAGRYELRFAAGEGSSAPAMHIVPFTVRAGCITPTPTPAQRTP